MDYGSHGLQSSVHSYIDSIAMETIAWCMILNPVDVRCGQSARDNIIDVIKPCSVLDGEHCLEDWVCRQSVKRCDWDSESFWIDNS